MLTHWNKIYSNCRLAVEEQVCLHIRTEAQNIT